ncbi:unnamed protein product, partial [Didymodactylos carnosus]
GCVKRGFDSSYPDRLNGIISPDEFHKSISNMNSSPYKSISTRSTFVVFILIMLAGVILVIVGSITTNGYDRENKGLWELMVGI